MSIILGSTAIPLLGDISDPAARIALGLMALQVGAIVWLLSSHYRHLWAAGRLARELVDRSSSGLSGMLQHSSRATAAGAESVKESLTTWRTRLPHYTEREEADAELSELFENARLIPRGFSPRLDTALPGLFIAAGIFGTFFGLIIAFGDAGGTSAGRFDVASLVRAMQAPFFNSALGVALSVLVTVISRMSRHRFDLSVDHLRTVLRNDLYRSLKSNTQRRAERETRTTEALTLISASLQKQELLLSQATSALGNLGTQLEVGFDRLIGTTQASSLQLVEQLAPRLEASMRTIVDAPFSQLGSTISSFASSTETLSVRQVELIERMQTSGEHLSRAQSSLAEATAAIEAQASALNSSSSALGIATTSVQQAVGDLRDGAGDLKDVRNWVEAGAARLGELLGMLEATRGALVTTSDFLATNADRYHENAERYNAALAGLRSAADAALDSSLSTMKDDLQAAAQAMAEALQQVSTRTIAAYETASDSVNEVLDSHMSSVADRLSAQLGALERLVPDEVNKMAQATDASRAALNKAIKSLEAVLDSIGERAASALGHQLERYDGAVKEIHERLAGTLATWEDRAESLERAVERLAAAVEGRGGRAA